MRRIPRKSDSILMLLMVLVGAGLVLSGILQPEDGVRGLIAHVGLAMAAQGSPEEIVSEAMVRFQEQRYDEAAKLFAAAAEKAPEFRAREIAYYQSAASLRLAVLRGEHQSGEEQRERLRALALDELDVWTSRALGELVASGGTLDGSTQGRLEEMLLHWENSADVEGATAEYLHMLEQGLLPYNGLRHRLPVERMWRNLVRVDAPRERLFAVAGVILGAETPIEFTHMRGRHIQPWQHRDPLQEKVARDVLAMNAPAWLIAPAHLQLAQFAARRSEFGKAVEHLEAVIAAIDAKDSEAAVEAARQLQLLTDPSLSIHSSHQLYRPGSYHQLGLNWRNLSSWSFTLWRVDPMEHLELPRLNEHVRADQWRDWLKEERGERVLTREGADEDELAARELDSKTPEARHVPRGAQLSLDPLDPGVYVLVAEGVGADDAEKVTARAVFQVTELGLTHQFVDATTLEAWLVRMDDGRPVGNAPLVFHSWRLKTENERGKSRRFSEYGKDEVRTGDDGLARVKREDDFQSFLIVGKLGEQPLVMEGHWGRHFGSLARDEWRGFGLTDRPLYRPGETVHLQAFVRRADPQERVLTTPAGTRVEARIVAADGTEMDKRNFALDDNGSIEWALELSERPPLGDYNVQLSRLDKGQRQETLAYFSFKVDEYRLPEFTVSVELDDEKRFVLGDTLSVDVKAEYLFGGPVRGEVELVVRRTHDWVYWTPHRRFAWLAPSNESGFEGYGGRIAYPGGGEEVQRERLPLGVDGRVTLRIPTPGDDRSGGDYRYTVEARVTDQSRREEFGRGSVRVTRQELYAFLDSARHLVAPGDEATITLRVQDGMGRPVAHDGLWTLSRREEGGQEEKIFTRLARTGESGEAELKFRPESTGYYSVRYETRDARRNKVRAETSVWCVDAKTRTVTHGAGALQLIAEQDEFIEGTTARVLLVSDTAGAHVYLQRFAGPIVETEVLRMTGTVKLLEIPLDDYHRPEFHLRAVTARDYRMQTAQLRVVAPLVRRMLEVELEFAEASFAPGDSARLLVRAKDIDGKPVKGPMTIAVVDEAVLALAPRILPDPIEILGRFPVRQPGWLPISGDAFGGWALLEESPNERHWPSRDGDDYDNRMDEFKSASGAFGEGTPLPASIAQSERAVMADAAMPMEAVGKMSARGGRRQELAFNVDGVGSGAEQPPMAAVSVRTDFRTTALWRTAVWTDEDGTAELIVPLSESLTKWEALAVAVTPDSRAGTAKTSTRTRKDVMVRLNHPRIFREDDRFVFAATVHNESDEELPCTVTLSAAPLQVEGGPREISLPAHGQVRVEWWAHVEAGSAQADVVRDPAGGRLRLIPSMVDVELTALTPLDSDAMRRPVKLLPFGTELLIAGSTELRAGEQSLSLELPRKRLRGVESAVLRLSPSVLSACVEALPYLADYPYGCTEQTLSRFVPAAAVRHAAQALGVKSKRIDPKLDEKTRLGVRRIADMQQGDGGWGWWKDGQSQPYMTSYALVALSRARQSEVEVPERLLRRGREALRTLLPRLEQRPDDLAYALFALAITDEALGRATVDEDETMARHFDGLFKARDGLRDYARALLASYAAMSKREEQGLLLLRHLDNTIERDRKYGTAHWGRLSGYWWRGEGAVETTSFVVDAYGRLEPDHETRREAARWLVANRRGGRWDNTRATAHAIYALADFASSTGELAADYELVARIGGQEIARLRVTARDLLDAGGEFPVPVELLIDGKNRVDFALEGEGVCYASLAVNTWTADEDPAPTEHWLGIGREIVRLRPQMTLGGAVIEFEEPLADGDAVHSGDRIRVTLTLQAHHDLDYLAIEDPRPAGTEPVDRLSGWHYAGGIRARREIRDELTGFFVSNLSEGTHKLVYELRAESPGTYRALPALAYAMYLPDVAGSSRVYSLEIQAEKD